MKVCKDCNIQKPLEQFPFRKDQNKHRPYCNSCQIIRRAPSRAVYLSVTKEHRAFVGKIYKQKNKDKIKESSRLYNIKNKEAIRVRTRTYEQNNKERMNKIRNEYRKNKIKSDPVYCMKLRLRARLKDYIRQKNWTKDKKFDQYISCSLGEFKRHIESRFTDGMNWENRHLWHLDHVAPASLAMSIRELEILNHYTNIRPLWSTENEVKSDSLTPEAIESIHNLEKLFNIVFSTK